MALGLRVAFFLGLSLALGGCISFRSVSVTASFGQLVGTRADAVTAFATFCEAENIFSGAQASCPRERVARYTQEVTLYSRSLARYATLMRNLAEFNDLRLNDDLHQLLLGLSRAGEIIIPDDDRQGQALAKAASHIASILSQSWRRNKLELLVQTAHPHILAILDGLLARVALLSEPARDLVKVGLTQRRKILEEVDRIPPARTGADAAGYLLRQVARLSLLHFEIYGRRSYDALVEYEKALSAFKRAHTILFEYATRQNDGLAKDGEIYDLLNKEVTPILR